MAEEEIKEEKKSNKGLIIAIVGILVLLILAIVIIVFIFLGGSKEAPAEGEASQTKESTEQQRGVTQRSDFVKLGPTFVIPEPFVVNLMGQNGRRYVKAQIALELSSPELQKEVTTKILLIKDIIIRVMSSKTFEEISTPKGRDKLKEEIVQEINTYIVDGYIKSILFSEFIIQ
ncbi:flagellar basal body-associated protein FliL [Helicobacter cholecystus]|uniref:Flagellar protein FliL n=1 Tax=Helicobacter cholecystus TaxID=45498 RepID=A0A3D8ITA5_9HELI|nr:flagellar basal body-associated FliL family protein [Helicobacter cholecystus]RDU68135.1 flagellar basal body-associated protein FliL [Helicobacter cholecystus]VEJ24392.1 Flagellar biosynthesis protein FliL [Helicobacter cholecystus]